MKYFVSEKKRIFADISLKEVIEKAKNSNSVTKEVECKRIQTRRFTCARLACGKDWKVCQSQFVSNFAASNEA